MDALDKTCIEILLKIGYFCGISPPNKNPQLQTNYHYYYSLLLLLAVQSLSVYSICSNYAGFYREVTETEAFMDFLASSCLSLQAAAIAISFLAYPEQMGLFFKELNDHVRGSNSKRAKNLAFLLLVTTHFAIILKFSWEWIAWLPIVKIKLMKNYIFRPLCDYFGMLTTCLIVHVNRVTQRRFSVMNNLLKRRSYLRGTLQTSYRQLRDLTDQLNRIFGYKILFNLANTVAIVLESLQALFFHAPNEQEERMNLTIWCLTSVTIALVS